MVAMLTHKVVICFALSVFFLGASSNGDCDLARAADRDPLSADAGSSSGLPSKSPAENPLRGEELYNASCVVCHGPRAAGGIGPRLAGNPVLSNDQAFTKIMSEGRHMMPPLTDAVTEQQMAGIRAWLKTLR